MGVAAAATQEQASSCNVAWSEENLALIYSGLLGGWVLETLHAQTCAAIGRTTGGKPWQRLVFRIENS